MIVATVLHGLMRIVNAISYANQIQAERVMSVHLARAGGKR